MIKIKRIYEDAEESDGFRILVDRLWPRGLSKERAKVDLWLKDIAPSDKLRNGSRMTLRSGANSSAGILKN